MEMRTVPNAPHPAGAESLLDVLRDFYPPYVTRYQTLQKTLAPLATHFTGKHVLDFGCGAGMSACVVAELGAASVTGVDVFAQMMARGSDVLRRSGHDTTVTLRLVEDTRCLPFSDEAFDTILCNAVFEHIPQPRDAYVREIWRLLKRGGVVIINETPNKYLPADFHTLHLPVTNWLPRRLAHRIGVLTGRFAASRADWDFSGWRGAGHFELLQAIPKEELVLIPELVNARQKLLHAVRLPSGLLDPYPLLMIQKRG